MSGDLRDVHKSILTDNIHRRRGGGGHKGLGREKEGWDGGKGIGGVKKTSGEVFKSVS